MRKSVKLITKAMSKRNLNKSDLARITNKVPQTLSKQLGKGAVKRDMTFDVFAEYAEALNYDIVLVDKESGETLSVNDDVFIAETKEDPIGIRITIEMNGTVEVINL